jgi:hypothetical protein
LRLLLRSQEGKGKAKKINKKGTELDFVGVPSEAARRAKPTKAKTLSFIKLKIK